MGAKKRRRRIMLLTLTAGLCLTLYMGCAVQEKATVLAAPEHLALSETEVLSWTGVECASEYAVEIGNGESVKEYRTEETELDLFEILTEASTYEIRVRAYGKSAEIVPSEESEAVEYTLEKPQGLGYRKTEDGLGYEVGAADAKQLRGKLVIPEYIDEVPVIRLAVGAFKDCVKLTGVYIPDSVETSGNAAFSGCASLRRVRLSGYMRELVGAMFDDCVSLERIVIPEGVEKIGLTAFRNSGLKSIALPDTLEDIYSNDTVFNHPFIHCPELSEITVSPDHPSYKTESGCLLRKSDNVLVVGTSESVIPEYATKIGNYAFYGRVGVKKATLPEGVTEIGSSAFVGTEIEEIAIPESVTKIGENAFRSSLLTAIEIPAGVTEIGTSAFACRNLRKIRVAEGNRTYKSDGDCLIRRADNTVVAGCLASVIPDYAETIGKSAFSDSGLTEITIPDGVKNIEEGAFSGSLALTEVTVPGSVKTIGAEAFKGCSALKNLYLCEGIERIELFAFHGCYRLNSVTFPKSLTEMKTIDGVYNIVSNIFIPGENGISSYSGILLNCGLAYDDNIPYVYSIVRPSFIRGDWQIPIRKGYTFAGWTTKEGSTVAEYEDVYEYKVYIMEAWVVVAVVDRIGYITEEEWKEIPEGTILYAIWIPET